MRQFQDYVKPEEAAAVQVRHVVATPADSDGAVAAASSLDDNTLSVNLGIPIVVVLTKVCYVNVTSLLVRVAPWMSAAASVCIERQHWFHCWTVVVVIVQGPLFHISSGVISLS